MATETVPSTSARPIHPPDSVRIGVSAPIEADFIARGVFPRLRHGNHGEMRSGTAMHWCDLSTAENLVADANARLALVAGPLRAAYGALIRNSLREIEEAKSRPSWLAGSEPKRLSGFYGGTRYLCTRAQLRLMGTPESLKLPGDAGGPARRAVFTDARGQTIGITRGDFAWPGAFVARVTLSDQAREEQARAHANAQQEGQMLRAIECLPPTATEFRERIARLYTMLTAMITEHMAPSDGYRFSADVVEEFKAESAHLLSLIHEGRITGRSRDEVKRQYLVGRAKGDGGLQTFLRLVHSSNGAQ